MRGLRKYVKKEGITNNKARRLYCFELQMSVVTQ